MDSLFNILCDQKYNRYIFQLKKERKKMKTVRISRIYEYEDNITDEEARKRALKDYTNESGLFDTDDFVSAEIINNNNNHEFILIDKKAADGFLHEMNHISLDFVPKEIQGLQFSLTTGSRFTIEQLIKEVQKRIAKLGGYIEVALSNCK
jgi:hypothetical protein